MTTVDSVHDEERGQLVLVPGKTCDIHTKQRLDDQGECPWCIELWIAEDTAFRRSQDV